MEVQRPSYEAYGGGRNLEIVDGKTLKNANQAYVVGRLDGHCHNHHQPSFDPSPHKTKVVKAGKDSSRAGKSWWNDPETKRKRRVAKYKIYSFEGKLKASFKKGYRWIKRKCSRVVHGF